MFLIVNLCFYSSVCSRVDCDIDDIGGVIYGYYDYFKCLYVIVVYFCFILNIFYVFIILYFLLCVIIFVWILLKFKKLFSFEEIVKKFDMGVLKLVDVKEVNGDFVFMFYFLNKYNKLYLYRFVVFLL